MHQNDALEYSIFRQKNFKNFWEGTYSSLPRPHPLWYAKPENETVPMSAPRSKNSGYGVPVKIVKSKTSKRPHIVSWLLAVTRLAWLRSTVGGTPVFGRRADPVLRSACSRRVTTMWVNRPLQVSQLGQLSLSSFRGR